MLKLGLAVASGSSFRTTLSERLAAFGAERRSNFLSGGAPNNAGGLLWGSWNDYPKVSIGGREYVQIGGRNYTHHAVDRMQPSGLG